MDGNLLLNEKMWWRAEKYGPEPGNKSDDPNDWIYITPASDKTRSLNPAEWILEHQIGQEAKKGNPPYLSLIHISLGINKEIVQWCSEFGLLGILHHRLRFLALWPQWVYNSNEKKYIPKQIVFDNTPYPRMYNPNLAPRILRDGSNFFSTPTMSKENTSNTPLTDTEAQEYKKYASPEILQFLPQLNYVEVTNEMNKPVRQNILEGYGQFFPAVDHRIVQWQRTGSLNDLVIETLNKSAFPSPIDDTFLWQYSEPISLFNKYIVIMKILVYLYRKLATITNREQYTQFLEDASTSGNLTTLFPNSIKKLIVQEIEEYGPRWDSISNALLFAFETFARVHQIPKFSPGSEWTIRLRNSSLFDLLSVWAYQDIVTEKKQTLLCKKCNNLFVTNRSDRKYCSDQCMWAYNKAQDRARKRDQQEDRS